MAPPLPLILGALSVAGQVGGAIQGNQQRQKAKGVIDQTYRLGRQRLGVRQQDQRASQSEALIARGLTGGGIRTRTAPIAPATPAYGGIAFQSGARVAPPRAEVPEMRVSGARTLGQQQQLDLGREQQLEQNALLEQRNAAVAGVDAGYANQLVGAVGGAIAGGIQGYQTGTTYNAYKGIDPVDPLARGAWAQPAVDALNIYQSQG